MTAVVEFDRTKHKVTATRKWARSGAVGAKGKEIQGAELGKLSDEDIVDLRSRGLVTVEDGRGKVGGDLAPAGGQAPPPPAATVKP